MPELSSYQLRKWRYRCLDRDKDRCQMCAVKPGRSRLQVHHIYPKALHPELAYEDANGVTLCLRCHKGVVHAENTWDLTNWPRFIPMFVAITEPDFPLPALPIP